MNERAILYRKMEGIPDEWGTAVNVQAMVFGNMGVLPGALLPFFTSWIWIASSLYEYPSVPALSPFLSLIHI